VVPDGQSIVVPSHEQARIRSFHRWTVLIWLRGGMDELRAPHGPINDLKNLARRQAGQLCSGARRRPYSP